MREEDTRAKKRGQCHEKNHDQAQKKWMKIGRVRKEWIWAGGQSMKGGRGSWGGH